MPGQFPTRAAPPVMRLNSVDFPVLGMPSKAMRFILETLIQATECTENMRVYLCALGDLCG